MTDMRRVVEALQAAQPDPLIRLRQGVIQAVAANGTATVRVGGSTVDIAGVKVSAGACPVPGATCWLLTDGRDWLVLATLAPTGPAWGTMRQSSAQPIGNGTFTAMSWANRSDVVTHGVTATSTGLQVKVPGLYSVTATPTFASNAIGQRHSQVTVNGAVAAQGASVAPQPNLARISCAAILKLAINDVVNVNLYQESGGNLNTTTGVGTGTLTVAWLGPSA